MKLSIITINLNNSSGLSKTIESVINQSFSSFEYIIIDGNSTDNSLEVIEKHSNRLTYWTSETDNGIYSAMNKGIAASSGNYLLFLNSGDYLASTDIIEACLPYLDGTDIIYGDLISAKGKLRNQVNYPSKLSFKALYYDSLPHPASFIKRDLLTSKTNGYDENLKICADWKFFMIALCKLNSSYQHISLPVAVYDTEGLSSTAESYDIICKEKEETMRNEFSIFENDIIYLNKLESDYKSISNSRYIKLALKIKRLFV